MSKSVHLECMFMRLPTVIVCSYQLVCSCQLREAPSRRRGCSGAGQHRDDVLDRLRGANAITDAANRGFHRLELLQRNGQLQRTRRVACDRR